MFTLQNWAAKRQTGDIPKSTERLHQTRYHKDGRLYPA